MGGFGGSRPLLGVQFNGFCKYFSSSGNCARKYYTQRNGDGRFPPIFVVFWKVRKGGLNEEAKVSSARWRSAYYLQYRYVSLSLLPFLFQMCSAERRVPFVLLLKVYSAGWRAPYYLSYKYVDIEKIHQQWPMSPRACRLKQAGRKTGQPGRHAAGCIMFAEHA